MDGIRGRVYWATVDGLRKPWLVVSNNERNRALGSCLGVRITTTPKPRLASIVELASDDGPMAGRVLCDNIMLLYPEQDAFEYVTALKPTTMARVDQGLKAALALR